MLSSPATVAAISCLLLLLPAADAWFFFRRYPTAKAKGKGIDASCTSLALQGSCDFYHCFEERLTCGRNWYNVKYGQPYCRDFKAFQSRFSLMGQKFINDSEVCMTQELLSWYERDAINCHDYTHFAFKAMSRCYIKSGFCEVIKEDTLNFATIYQPKHLFSRGALKIWREIIRLAYHCEPQGFKDIITTFFESIRD